MLKYSKAKLKPVLPNPVHTSSNIKRDLFLLIIDLIFSENFYSQN